MYFIHVTDNEPQLVVEPENLNIHITEGNETAVLHCNAFGADTYTWERRDDIIPDKAVLREAGTILEIPNIRRGEAGSYRCIVENSAGRSTSQYSDIIVTGEIICSQILNYLANSGLTMWMDYVCVCTM